MKKFEMLGRSLSKADQKRIMGGLAAQNACESCSRICYSTSAGGGEYGYGNCNQQGSAGHPAICDNYCCSSSNTYWCNA